MATTPVTIIASDSVFVQTSNNDTQLDFQQDGRLWVHLYDDTNNGHQFWYSTDGGATWTHSTSSDLFDSNEPGAFFIDKDDYAHLGYYDTVVAANVYRLGTPSADHTSFTWSSPLTLSGSGTGSGINSLVAHREGSGWYAHVVGIQLDTGVVLHYHWKISIDSAHNVSSGGSGVIKNWGASLSSACSLDFRHTASDPKDVQSSTPSLYFVVSDLGGALDPGLLYYKATYSAGPTWTWSGETEITTAQQSALPSLVYDGTRVMIATMNTATLSVVRVWERDEANTTSTARDPTALGLGTIQSLSMGVGRNGDVWLVTNENTDRDLKYIRFNRGGLSWDGAWTLLEADTSSQSGIANVMRGMSPAGLGVAYDIQGPAPDQTHFSMLLSAYLAEATLQGVGTVAPSPQIGFKGEASLQGVGAMTPQGNLALAGGAALQGVATLSPSPLYTPKKDFTVYDGYIDNPVSGTIPFIYFEDDSARAQTTSVPLRPPRTDTGQEPTEVRPESGEVFSQQDFSHGAGQLYFHHEGRDVRRFLWSEGFEVEIDTVGQPTLLHHLNDVPNAAFTSATIGKIEVFNDFPFVIDGTNIKKGSGDFPGFWTNENPGGTPQDITSSGEYLYAALGAAGIARRNTAGAWSTWQATPLATRIAWVKNRIMASDGPIVYEITDTVRTVETLPLGWVFEAIFEAGGFIYAVANNASSGLSRISTYGLNSSGDALEKKNETPFPRNQLMYSGRGFLGSVYIGGGIKNSSEGFDPVVYQAFPQDNGALTYLKVNEGEGAGAVDLSVKALEPIGEDIVFGWSLGSGFDFGPRDGLAIHKPKVDAFLGYLKKGGPGAGRQVLGIALYRGRLLFTLKGDGLYYEDTTHFVSQAQLWTSVADWQTSAKKSWDTIQVSHNRLPASTSVRAEYSTRLPSEGIWNPGVFSNVAGSEVAETGFTDVTSQMISLLLTSTANAGKTEAPSGLGFLVRSNVIPDHPEFGLTRYVRLVNKDRKDSDAPMVFTDVVAVRRKLHNLAYQWVTLYEPGVIWTLHVDAVAEVQPFLVEYDATLGEGQAQGYVVQLTMTGTRD